MYECRGANVNVHACNHPGYVCVCACVDVHPPPESPSRADSGAHLLYSRGKTAHSTARTHTHTHTHTHTVAATLTRIFRERTGHLVTSEVASELRYHGRLLDPTDVLSDLLSFCNGETVRAFLFSLTKCTRTPWTQARNHEP